MYIYECIVMGSEGIGLPYTKEFELKVTSHYPMSWKGIQDFCTTMIKDDTITSISPHKAVDGGHYGWVFIND